MQPRNRSKPLSHNRRSARRSTTSSPTPLPSPSPSTCPEHATDGRRLTMLKTSAVVVGAGHCGLAMSRCLADRSIDHVVLERGEAAHSWRTQWWDSLRLLTPNWMNRLPGYAYRGDDPDGYLASRDVAELIEDYAKESAAPVLANTAVTSVRHTGGGYVVQTDQGTWRAESVVLASGASTVANVPVLQASVPCRITALTPAQYRNPSQLPDGGGLLRGARASGNPTD